MRKSDSETLKTALLEQRRDLLERASQRFERDESVDTKNGPEYAADRAAEEVNDRIAASEDILLEKIDRALERLDEGIYDRCAECGEKIPLARLKAKPAVSLCVDCQEKKEQSPG